MSDDDWIFGALGPLLVEHGPALAKSGAQAGSSAGKAGAAAAGKRPDIGIRSEGTLTQLNEKLYWFRNELSGVEIQPPKVFNLFMALLRRKLTPFETGLVLSRPIDGSVSITVISKLMPDTGAPLGIASLNVKRVVIGYLVNHHERTSRFMYGNVVGATVFYDIDGNVLRKVSETRKNEPGLETPLLDPIDFIGGALADLGKMGLKALFRAIADALEREAVDVVAANVEEILEKKASTVFEEISRDDLSEIQGGAARPGGEPKPFSAEELNKPVPKAKGQGGPKRRLDKDERLAVIKIVGALERVSQSDAATAEEIKSAVETALPTRRVKNLTRELRGWTEIDVLPDNPGWNNTMRVLYKVKNDVWQLRLLDMHGVTELY